MSDEPSSIEGKTWAADDPLDAAPPSTTTASLLVSDILLAASAFGGKLITEIIFNSDGSRIQVKKKVKQVVMERPVTMADVRSGWERFGLGTQHLPEVAVKDPSINLELGGNDPLKKQCHDEVLRIVSDFDRQTVTNEDTRIRQLTKQLNSSASPTSQQQAATSKPVAAPVKPEKGEEGLTWGQANANKKKPTTSDSNTNNSNQPNSKNAKGEAINRAIIRISNISDDISDMELKRLFGEENGLGKIKRLYIAKDNSGNRKGFAYVTYLSDADGVKAVEKMGRTAFKNVVMLVDFGTTRN